MSRARQCDKCEKFYSKKDLEKGTALFVILKKDHFDFKNQRHRTQHAISLHLCPDCSKKQFGYERITEYNKNKGIDWDNATIDEDMEKEFNI